MTNIKLLITSLALLFCATSFAQELSKKEQKELEKEMLNKAKDTDPVQLKKMFDEYPKLTSEVSGLKTKVSSLESSLVEKDTKISSLQSDLNSANEKIKEMELAATTNTVETSGATDETNTASKMNGGSAISRPTGQVIPGLVYKVQIGAFRNKDLTKYFNNSSNFGGEVDQDGTKKYSIGQFTEYWEADAFKKYMREMGVKDAWIVPYFNGKRVSMKDAREGVLN